MSDSLKQHIDQNREEFEVFPFDAEMGWQGLSVKKKAAHRYLIWPSAAAVVLLLVWVGYRLVHHNMQPQALPVEVVEAGHYYEDIIAERIFAIQKHGKATYVTEDLEVLDQIFEELKADLNDNAQNEAVVQAMIETYRLKIKILERILDNMEVEKNEEISRL